MNRRTLLKALPALLSTLLIPKREEEEQQSIKEMTESAGDSGGYWVPEEFQDELHAVMGKEEDDFMLEEEYQGDLVMQHFDADKLWASGFLPIKAYLDGEEVGGLTKSMYALSQPGFETRGWCELFVLDSNGSPFSLEVGSAPVTEIREGMVRWEPTWNDALC